MDFLLWVVLAVFFAFALVAIVFIFKACKKAQIRSEVHFSGGANIEKGYLSKDDNYFKGGYVSGEDTLVVDVDYRNNSENLMSVKLTDLKTGQVFRLGNQNSVILGRNCGEGYFEISSDVAVSKSHCRILIYKDCVFVEDLNSSNKTYVNSRMITSACRLSNGDVIKIGHTYLKVEF